MRIDLEVPAGGKKYQISYNFNEIFGFASTKVNGIRVFSNASQEAKEAVWKIFGFIFFRNLNRHLRGRGFLATTEFSIGDSEPHSIKIDRRPKPGASGLFPTVQYFVFVDWKSVQTYEHSPKKGEKIGKLAVLFSMILVGGYIMRLFRR
jgi:hypothetical protein